MSIKLLKPQEIKEVKVVTRYDINDFEFVFDYREIHIFVDGELAIEFGDYGEKGEERADTYVDCLRQSGFVGEFLEENIADYEC